MYPALVLDVVAVEKIWPIVLPVKAVGSVPLPPFNAYVTVRGVAVQTAKNKYRVSMTVVEAPGAHEAPD